MTHYYTNSDGSIYTSQTRHEMSWTITSSSRLKDIVIGCQTEVELSEDNQKLDNFLKTFAKE